MKSANKKEFEDYPPPVRLVLNCLSSESQWLPLLKGRNKPYDGIITSLQQFFNERKLGSNHIYTIIEIAKIFDLKPSVLAKWLHQMYNDIFELNNDEPELFKTEGTMFNLNFQYYHKSCSFTLWLSAPLLQYEEFTWYFLEAKLRFRSFYVESIIHQYNAGAHLVEIFLNTLRPNTYRQFIYEKTLFYNLINQYDSMNSSQFDLEERLKKIYPH